MIQSNGAIIAVASRLGRSALLATVIIVAQHAVARSLTSFVETVWTHGGDIVGPRAVPWTFWWIAFIGFALAPLPNASPVVRLGLGLLRSVCLGLFAGVVLSGTFDWIHVNSPRHSELWDSLHWFIIATLAAWLPWREIFARRARSPDDQGN